MEEYRIIHVGNHYEAYDSDRNFVLSGDSFEECYEDLKEIMIENAKECIA